MNDVESEVLGYDCNWKALRAGDQVEIIDTSIEHSHFKGHQTQVVGRSKHFPGEVDVDIPGDFYQFKAAQPKALKKLYDGDQPVDMSLEEVVENIKKQGVSTPVAQ